MARGEYTRRINERFMLLDMMMMMMDGDGTCQDDKLCMYVARDLR